MMDSADLRRSLEEERGTARDQLSAAWQLHITRIEEQLSTGWKDHLERVIEERFGGLAGRLEEALAQELEARWSDLRSRFRRLRESQSEAALYQTLLDDAGAICGRAALFLVDDQIMSKTPLASAPALLRAIESRETVVAEGSADELSPELAGFQGRTAFVPVVRGDKVVAVLCVGIDPAGAGLSGLELLAMLAGVTLEARAAVTPPQAPELPPEEREIHSRAQRFARVQVAQMRLYQAQAVRTGRAQHDLYSALSREIDAARDAFRIEFVAPCASMADYLHQELILTLANDDPSLLGPAYPGPLV